MSRAYPFSAWVLTLQFTIKKVSLVKESNWPGKHEASTGMRCGDADLFSSKEAAIDAGRRRLDHHQAVIDRSTARLAKHRLTFAEYSQES
jgi:hypothetical protein